jgi:membrane protein DedA with SNARE-associated domain
MKKATTFLFVVLNGTWALMAYMLHRGGVHPMLIVTVVAIGVLLGNLAAYAGLRLAKKLLRKSG